MLYAHLTAHALGRSPVDFRVGHHAYVSGDPSVAPGGTALPFAAAPCDAALHPIGDVMAAALVATRCRPEALLGRSSARRVLFELAASQGWRDTKLLAKLCGASERTAYRQLAGAAAPPDAALLCLGDTRLRAPLAATIPPFVSRMLTLEAHRPSPREWQSWRHSGGDG